ncbi:FAD dependent oxidoreductase [Lindgomyces ingoldianus]|uniref:FAD dependent oxidoreductase n=1 Tax=Lindgomyces ingoldianus TaxID=673940 RepID=A0ACB6QW47_9PLEO|nr:FAD dependent oxidoreductase [Lindgomyces ingoldianus]KAF2471224.1 FAD dependent oxidoreductase [Lindgomyces ingoldianus]
MANPPLKTSPILIVGAGVFGLSTALYLHRSGYSNVTIFDRQPYFRNAYSTLDGADAASADINKVMRLSYGKELLYQKLAFEAIDIWNEWNQSIAKSKQEDLPRGIEQGDKIWNNCGFLRLSKDGKISQFEEDTLESLEREGLRDTQYVIGDANDEKRARQFGLQRRFDPMDLRAREGALVGVYDTLGGFVNASKACTWVLHLLSKTSVKLILGGDNGSVTGFIRTAQGKTVGINTADGISHYGELVLVAAGPWTPTLLPHVANMLEATAGSVAYIQLPPKEETPDLWTKYAPENMAVYSWGGWGKGSGLGGFPRSESGVMKIGYRGTKYTNYMMVVDERAGKVRSVSQPVTASWPEKREEQITKQAVDAIKGMVCDLFPDLKSFGISSVRNCWYTDSLDNNFVMDRDPEDEGLMVCSGGSGHAFKFLPILGREAVRIIEEPTTKNEYGNLWRWRTIFDDLKNGLEEGETGPRVWAKQRMASKKDWEFQERVNL